jgi:PAS domain S-box-containing protein
MKELELLKRKLEREKLARKQAEAILESKALELFHVNDSLKKLNESLEDQIKERTEALQESELKYRKVIDQATDIIYTTDEEGFFTFINPIGAAAFGFSKNEILGKRYIEFVPDEYKVQLFDYYTKIKEDQKTYDYFEFPIRSKTGELHWIGQNVNRVVDKSGTAYFNAVARDITPRKDAEKKLEAARKALTKSEVKYRSVLENMELGLMEVGVDGRIARVYDRFCAMTGYTKEELLGKDAIETVLVPEFKDTLLQQDQSRMKGQTGVYEVQLKRKDGKHIWVLISGAPFYDDKGEVIGSLGIHYDISDRKELARKLEIERAKAVKAQQAEQNFLANMSHEIRTPLNAIIGMTHLLKDSKLDVKQEEYIEILDTSASLLKGLVSDILDISKIDSGMAEINLSNFDLKEVASRLVKTFSIRTADKDITLSSSIINDGNTIVESDRQWLNQILINLISNAIKFTSEGEVNLKIERLKSEDFYHTYYFEVTDTGIGMSQDEVATIFTEFKQANTTVRKDYGGSGLGLSIASRLVTLLGGELEVESKEDEGSRFYFTLSLKSGKKESGAVKQLSDYSLAGIEDVKILVVEDNYMNQRYISSLLEKWDIDYAIVDNGKEAVETYKHTNFDLIFMDLSMPVMDGYEATQIIRSQDGLQIPIIALTASTFLSKKQLALEAGMSDFLAKPFTPEDLSRMIHKYIKKGAITPTSKPRSFDYNEALDVDELKEMYGGDQEYAVDMFLTYLDIIDQEIATLSESGRLKKVGEIRAQAHKIKPMFEMVGLKEISNLCEALEHSSDLEDIESIKEQLKKVISRTNNSKHIILSEVQRLKSFLSS